MKPKTQIQKRVVELSRKLPSITQSQIKYAFDNCLQKIAFRKQNGNIITCLECNHVWQAQKSTQNDVICPCCNRKLLLLTTNKRTSKEIQYMSIITTYKEFQVIRFFWVEVKYKIKEAPRYIIQEVVQLWIEPNGKYTTMSLYRNSFGMYYDQWIFNSEMEIKPHNHIAYNIKPIKTYPRKKYIPELKRNGLKGHFYGIQAFDLFRLILSDNKAETLLKTKQYELLRYYEKINTSIQKH